MMCHIILRYGVGSLHKTCVPNVWPCASGVGCVIETWDYLYTVAGVQHLYRCSREGVGYSCTEQHGNMFNVCQGPRR